MRHVNVRSLAFLWLVSLISANHQHLYTYKQHADISAHVEAVLVASRTNTLQAHTRWLFLHNHGLYTDFHSYLYLNLPESLQNSSFLTVSQTLIWELEVVLQAAADSNDYEWLAVLPANALVHSPQVSVQELLEVVQDAEQQGVIVDTATGLHLWHLTSLSSSNLQHLSSLTRDEAALASSGGSQSWLEKLWGGKRQNSCTQVDPSRWLLQQLSGADERWRACVVPDTGFGWGIRQACRWANITHGPALWSGFLKQACDDSHEAADRAVTEAWSLLEGLQQEQGSHGEGFINGSCVVTAGSEAQARPLLNLERTLHMHNPDAVMFVYDLGLGQEARKRLLDSNNVVLRPMSVEELPPHLVQGGAVTMLPQALLVRQVLQECSAVLWLDSGVVVNGSLAFVFDRIAARGFIAGTMAGTPAKWAAPQMLEFFGVAAEQRRADVAARLMANSQIVGFRHGSPAHGKVALTWAWCTMRRDCIAAGGTDRLKKQDAAALTIIMYSAGFAPTPLPKLKAEGNLLTHQEAVRTEIDEARQRFFSESALPDEPAKGPKQRKGMKHERHTAGPGHMKNP